MIGLSALVGLITGGCFNYRTTSHLTDVRVTREVFADKEAGAALRVTLRKQGGAIEVVDVR